MNLLDQAFSDDTSSSPPVSKKEWSEFQQNVFTAVETKDSNLLIQAVAGSGKTTTIIEAMRFATGRSLFMAFNKSIALDIAAKAPFQDVKTLNALGYWQWKQNEPSAQLNSRKTLDILKKLMPEQDFKDFGYTLSRVVGLAKNNALGIAVGPPAGGWSPPSPDSLQQTIFQLDPQLFVELIDSYQMDIPWERLDQCGAWCAEALALGLTDMETMDFDDQLYVPAFLGWDYPGYDTVFVDECQDLSPIQHLMLERLQAKGARIISVGDRHQAIYGFRGALSDSMGLLKQRFSMLELPLSISYRCDRAIISEAQLYCPTIESRPGAGPGSVSYRDDEDPLLFSDQLIVCRNNAPLFRAILRHYRAKSPCRVLSNFLESFQGFIRGFKTTYTSDLSTKLDRWFEKEREAAEKKGFRGKIAGLLDKYETVSLFCKEFSKTEDILHCVKRLGECQFGPTFATVHKAKGLEHESVYILRPDLVPSKYAATPEAKQQEANLIYVAVTRAKHNLVYGAMQR